VGSFVKTVNYFSKVLLRLNNKPGLLGSGSHGIELKTQTVFCSGAIAFHETGIGKSGESSGDLTFISASEFSDLINP
jgi:hypothetical protein